MKLGELFRKPIGPYVVHRLQFSRYCFMFSFRKEFFGILWKYSFVSVIHCIVHYHMTAQIVNSAFVSFLNFRFVIPSVLLVLLTTIYSGFLLIMFNSIFCFPNIRNCKNKNKMEISRISFNFLIEFVKSYLPFGLFKLLLSVHNLKQQFINQDNLQIIIVMDTFSVGVK